MVNFNNLYLVKVELINLNDLIEEYKEVFYVYCRELISDEVKDWEYVYYEEKFNDIMVYLYLVYVWIL